MSPVIAAITELCGCIGTKNEVILLAMPLGEYQSRTTLSAKNPLQDEAEIKMAE